MLDPKRSDLCVGVIGAGTMGRGIAQVAATAGIKVLLFDSSTDVLASGVAFITGMIERAVEKGRMEEAGAKAALARIETVEGLEGFSGCHLVIEAVIEDMDLKKEIFATLDKALGPDAVIATNTSSLSVTEIASATKSPGRIAGMHFFNPPPLMKLVEVIGGIRTEAWATEALVEIAKRMGKTPVAAADSPGFLVNHAGRAYTPEGLRIVFEGIADFPAVDRIMRDAAGFRMGPFQLMDLVGLDIAHSVIEEIYHQYYEEPMYRPNIISRQRVAAGLLGRKTGEGFYVYEDGKQIEPPEAPAPSVKEASIWIGKAPDGADKALGKIFAAAGAELSKSKKPAKGDIAVVLPVGGDATTAALAEDLDPKRTVAVDPIFGLDARRTLMTTPVTEAACRDAAWGLLAADGVPVTVINDSPGFVAQRIVALIVNIGCNIAQQRIAAPEDIDTAVKLGLNYPQGPLEWGDALGPDVVLRILEGMHDFYGDPRYRPSPWLKRRAGLGVALRTPEGA